MEQEVGNQVPGILREFMLREYSGQCIQLVGIEQEKEPAADDFQETVDAFEEQSYPKDPVKNLCTVLVLSGHFQALPSPTPFDELPLIRILSHSHRPTARLMNHRKLSAGAFPNTTFVHGCLVNCFSDQFF